MDELPDPAKQRLQQLQHLSPMRCRAISLAQRELSLWTAADADTLLDALAEKDADHPDVLDERMPYWAELWPSATVLSSYLLSAEQLPQGPWVELGCGPGLAGLCARLRGREGLYTDYMQEALWLADLNGQSNQLPAANTRILDWREGPGELRTPWILATDVAYEIDRFPPLISCLETLLLPGGELWLGEPGRPVARFFFQELTERGWQDEILFQQEDIRIHRLRFRPASD